jgi:CheY-specific phosphatase CheX
MQNLETSIKEYVRMVWSTLFEQSVFPDINHVDPQSHLAIVDISGQWNGCINIYIPSPLASSLAEKMFFLEAGTSSKSEVQDAIGEVINMIGGNIKAILPEPNQLSTPKVIWEAKSYEWSQNLPILASASFKSECGHTFNVQVRQSIEN